MSFQNTIKSMNKFNRSTLREIKLRDETFGGENIRNEITHIQNILQEIKQENSEPTTLTLCTAPRFEEIGIETINSPRIANLKQIKEKLELKMKEHKPLTPLTPCIAKQLTPCTAVRLKPRKPPKIINSKIANNK